MMDDSMRAREMPQLGGVSRRSFVTSALVGSTLLAGGGLMAGCASGGSRQGIGSASGSGTKSADNPFGVDKRRPLDVVIFNGGHGDQYGAEHVALYNRWAGQSVAKMTSTVRIAGSVQPRFAGGNPPDVLLNGGADAIPAAQLVAQNQLADLAELLEAPTFDDPSVKIGDLLMPGSRDYGDFDGVYRQLGYILTVWGLWRSSKLFEDRDWAAPARTWDEFMGLCEKIKSTGMAPFIHTGVHTQYLGTMLTAMAIKHGGRSVMINIDTLREGSWANDSVLTAAKAIEDLYRSGFIMAGSEGLDHTTAQAQWLNGDAAMIPCGSWLEKEMEGKIPDGFDMVMQPFPALTSTDALPFGTIAGGAQIPFVVAENGSNKAGALEYLRIMLSNDGMKQFSRLTGSLVAVKNAANHLDNPSVAQKSVAEAVVAAGDNVFSTRYGSWYIAMNDAQKNAMANLAAGRSTAEQYCDTMEEEAKKIRVDPRIRKFTRT